MTQAGLDQRHVLQSGLHASESIEKRGGKFEGGGVTKMDGAGVLCFS